MSRALASVALVLVLVLIAAPATRAQRGPAFELLGAIGAGRLVRGRVEPGAEVRLDGRRVRVSARGSFVLGFAADRSGAARITIRTNGRRIERRLTIDARRYATERISGVPRALVVLEGQVRRAQSAIEERLSLVRAHDGEVAFYDSGFVRPAAGRVSSEYGIHRVFDGVSRERHWGLDIVAPEGDRVIAPADGVIVLDVSSPIYGRMLVIDHGHGLTSSLLHLSRVDVDVGAIVRRGETIARIGRSGRVTGAHLDWRVHLFGVPLDPLSALEDLAR